MGSVLLFSGGLDSYCLNQIIRPSTRLYIPVGTQESETEKANIERCPYDVEIAEEVNLSQFELDNNIIPHRNTIFALIASNYGNSIYLGATKGDTTKDKDFTWKSQTESQLNYFGKDSHKNAHDDYPFQIKMPFKDLTKTEIVEGYLDSGGSPLALAKYSTSCYHTDDEGLECGDCRSCIRKGVAFRLNGIYGNLVRTMRSDPLEGITEEQYVKMYSREGEGADFRELIEKYPEYEP